jgi:hypothetical protein
MLTQKTLSNVPAVIERVGDATAVITLSVISITTADTTRILTLDEFNAIGQLYEKCMES